MANVAGVFRIYDLIAEKQRQQQQQQLLIEFTQKRSPRFGRVQARRPELGVNRS